MSVTIHGHPMSTWTRTARMALLERGVDHAVQMPAFGQPEHARVHPFRKMPALETSDGLLRFESLAIGAWADAMGAGVRLLPDAPEARSAVLQWYSAAVDYLYRPVVHGSDDAARDAGLDALDAAYTGRTFLVGDGPTLADLAIVPMLAWHAREQEGAARLAARPALVRVLRWWQGRPSFVATAA